MLTDHLRRVMERLIQQPASVQERYATFIEVCLDQEAAQAAQAPQFQRQTAYQEYLLGVNPLEKYYERVVDRFSHLSEDEVLAMEAAGEVPESEQ